MQEFLRVQNVFDGLDAQSGEKGEPALKAKLIDTSVEGFIILGYCRQHPTQTIYEATASAYRDSKSLRKHTIDAPIENSLPIVLSDIICSPAEVQAGSSARFQDRQAWALTLVSLLAR
jgi:hypothetical protein